jgi:syntaxin 5
MSYKYDSLSTTDQSTSFFGQQALSSSQDITNYLFQMANKSRALTNARPMARRSEFLNYSQQLEKEIKKTGATLKKLHELTNKTTLFNTEDAKINDLIANAKDSISGIQKKINFLQSNNDLVYTKQGEKMSKHILEILNLRFMEITKEFKNLLEKRTKTIKQFKEKESFLSMAGTNSSEIRSRRPNKTEAAFLKKGKAYDPEENAGAYTLDMDGRGPATTQQSYDLEGLRKKNESVKSIQKTMEEIMGIFTRISSMVQMHEVMIERIDKDTEDTLRNVEGGKKNLVKIFKDMSSTRRLIISVFIFLMFFATIYIFIS